MRSMFVRQTMAGVYPSCQCGSCSLFGFFDVDFIFKGAFHLCYRELTFNTCIVDLTLVEFIFDPTPSSSTLDSATSNLTLFSSEHYEPFHANPPLTHTHEMSAHALLVMNNLGVVVRAL